MLQTGICVALIILLIIAALEIFKPKLITEGFDSLIAISDSAFWEKYFPRRGDISTEPTEEQKGYIRDIRYFNNYADVQRLGVDHDFCRMLSPEDDEEDKFFACALASTEGLSSIKYKTPSVKQGFELSRDDYMADVLKEGRDGYCRIVKVDNYTFLPKCNPASDNGFKSTMITDTSPPKDIATLMSFYEGIVFWLRLRDDMLDYAKNLHLNIAGKIEIKESPPNPQKTEGLEFNGIDQYLKIGDSKSLEFGDIVQLKYLRAISTWVYFEEFTNNAHIIDFGNGAGKDNVFMGIIGRGNEASSQPNIPLLCYDQATNTVPSSPSGQQCTEITTPQELMETTAANVNDYDCPKPELFGKIMKPLIIKASPPQAAKTADLVYEIWDEQQRKMHIQVKNVIPLKKWVHIVITAENADAFKPDIGVYINNKKIYVEKGGWLPQTNYTTSNYIGKSNWQNVTSQYQNADELFKGKIFDLRGYRTPMSEKKVKDTYNWGKQKLGL